MYDVMVIGNGLIGSAAARYLTQRFDRVGVIGPSEPVNISEHHGVFSSHYDEGRLVSSVSEDPIWSVLASRSVQAFDALQRRSGINFHGPVGRIRVTKPAAAERVRFLAWLDGAKQDADAGLNFAAEYFEPDDRSWKDRFPFLDFPPGYAVYLEHGPAGYVNPRRLLAAQNAVAKQQGAHVIDKLVTAVDPTADGVTVRTGDGSTYSAGMVLITSGAFTNFGRLLPQPLPLRLKTESIVLGAVSPQTATRLEAMPCVGYDIEDPEIDDIYMAPPLRYPDGRYQIKLGCNTVNEFWPESLEEVQVWFRSGNSDADLPAMERALRSVLPDVDFAEIASHRCIVTYSPSGYPTIDAAPGDLSGRLFVATGGNGNGAHASDGLGHVAADLLSTGRWPDELQRKPFLATNDWGDATKKLSKAQQRAVGRG